MEKYLVLYFKPLDKKRVVKKFEVDSLDIAKKLAEGKKKHFYDVLIVKEKFDSKDDNIKKSIHYEIVKYGYYNVYNWMNYIIFLILFISISFFCYLYYINVFTNP